MRSPVNWALLGLVIDRPSYGYELVLRFKRVYGGVLAINSDSHIYGALDMLERKGLIEETTGQGAVRVDSGRRRQPKLHYRATGSSVEQFEEWLLAQTRENRRQSQLFVRQLTVYDPKTALRVLDRYEQECLRSSARTSVAPAGLEGDRSRGLIERLSCEEDRLVLEARLDWVQYARRELVAIAESGARGDDAAGA